MNEFAAGPLTRDLWLQAQPTIREIEALPFLRELVSGVLKPLEFTFYILQDDLYLAGYARAMALLAAKAGTPEQTRFWAESVTGAIAAEEDMHRTLLADARLAQARSELGGSVPASPTTLGYVSYLEASAALKSYAVGVAAVLPCFWVYAHVGKMLTQEHSNMAPDHPYKAWIAMYDSPVFDQATQAAVAILEQCLGRADAPGQNDMQRAFLQSCVYEWHFWHAAHTMQDWTLPAPA